LRFLRGARVCSRPGITAAASSAANCRGGNSGMEAIELTGKSRAGQKTESRCAIFAADAGFESGPRIGADLVRELRLRIRGNPLRFLLRKAERGPIIEIDGFERPSRRILFAPVGGRQRWTTPLENAAAIACSTRNNEASVSSVRGVSPPTVGSATGAKGMLRLTSGFFRGPVRCRPRMRPQLWKTPVGGV